MRSRTLIGAATALGVALVGAVVARSAFQSPAIRSVDEKVLREYAGVYQWGPDAFAYLQMWNEAARQKLAVRIGRPPDTFPADQNHPQWQVIRRMYLYDPAPTLRELKQPTLALFGELDNNIVAEKNKAAWDAALKAGGHQDYTLRILPRANHMQLEAKAGTNAEAPSLHRFVPEYFTTVRGWLAQRIRGFETQTRSSE